MCASHSERCFAVEHERHGANGAIEPYLANPRLSLRQPFRAHPHPRDPKTAHGFPPPQYAPLYFYRGHSRRQPRRSRNYNGRLSRKRSKYVAQRPLGTRSSAAAGSCWRVRLGGCRRRHSTTLIGIHRPAATFIRGLRMRATSGEGILSGERVERRLAAILADRVAARTFNAWASPAG